MDALWSGSGIGAATSATSQNHASNHRNHFNYDPSEILSRGSSSSNNQNDPHHQFRHNSDSTSCNSNMDFIPGELYQQRPRLASDEVTLRCAGGSDSVVTESIHSSAIGSNSSTVNNSYFSSDKSSKINDPESSCPASTLGGSRLTISSSSSNPDPAVRLSHYDNFTTTQDGGIQQGKSSQEENEVLNLTEQIKQLTVNAELDLLDLKPPLPTKKGGSGSGSGMTPMTQHQHLSNRAREHFMRAMNSPLSQYDNFVVSGGGAAFTRADTVDMTSSSGRCCNWCLFLLFFFLFASSELEVW